MIFACATDRPKHFVQALTAISLGGDSQTASFRVSDDGFVFATKEKQTFLGMVTIPSTQFKSFIYVPQEEEQNFSLNLSKLINCMRIFANSAKELEFKAKSDSEIEIIITDTDSITTSIIRCLISDPIDTAEADFDPVFDISIHSDALRELFRFPTDPKNSSYSVTLVANQTTKKFSVAAEGAYGDVIAEMPQTLAEWKIIENPQEIQASYTSQSILPFLHGLSLSQEARVRMSSNGVFKVNVDVHGSSVVFIIEPLVDDN